MLYIFFFFSLRWVSCTPNSTVGHLSIFTSRLTFSFLSRFRALAPFYFLVLLFFFSFFRALISWNNVASGSNQNNWSIYFTGNNMDRIMFFGYSLLDRSRIILDETGDGNEWMYVDAYFRSRKQHMWVNVQVNLDLTTWQAPKGLHSLTTLNAHKQ